MVLTLNRSPELVTPLGLWLVRKIDRLTYIMWPFVKRSSYNRLTFLFSNEKLKNNELEKALEDFEEFHFSSYLPLSLNVDFKVEDLNSKPFRRFRLETENLSCNFEVDTRSLRHKNKLTPDIVERLIRLTSEAWSNKAEQEMRRYFREVYDYD